ncbi:hypothetical protein M9435_003752 [Picochlorum sp. BPE23]|nr:hypothetical protein M9435_003752 [Picochlorum sp. BPE23]
MAEDNVQHHDIEKERPQRRKLHLKPRDPEAAARIEAERLRESYQHGVFGDAKPREVVIADRVGKSEEDILKEEVQKEKLHLRLTPAQHEEKKSHEAAVKEIEDQIEKESDEKKKDLLRVELRARVETLDALMERFVAMTLENAKSGDVPRVSQLRKVQHEMHQHERGGAAGVVHQHRYKPTQQYTSRHPGQQYTGRGGGHPPRGGGGGRSGYVPTPVDGGRYGRGGVPEWAHHQPGRGGGGGGIDAGAVMYPEYSAHRGGRGGGGGRQQLPPRDVFYQGPFPGRGVGGEIEFDSFSDQDRY